MAGALLTIAGVWLWRRRFPQRWYGVFLGSLLLLVAPYLISSLGRGITPPAAGVSVPLAPDTSSAAKSRVSRRNRQPSPIASIRQSVNSNPTTSTTGASRIENVSGMPGRSD